MEHALLAGLTLVIALDAGVRISQLVEQIIRHRFMRRQMREVRKIAEKNSQALIENITRIVERSSANVGAGAERPN